MALFLQQLSEERQSVAPSAFATFVRREGSNVDKVQLAEAWAKTREPQARAQSKPRSSIMGRRWTSSVEH